MRALVYLVVLGVPLSSAITLAQQAVSTPGGVPTALPKFSDATTLTSSSISEAPGGVTVANPVTINAGPGAFPTLSLYDPYGQPESSSGTGIVFSGADYPFGYAAIGASGAYFSGGYGVLNFATAKAGVMDVQMMISPFGNVGIGTPAPGGELSIVLDSGDETEAGEHIFNTNPTGYSVLRLGTDQIIGQGFGLHQFNQFWPGDPASAIPPLGTSLLSFNSGGMSFSTTDPAGALKFFTGGTASGNERMVITPSGLVALAPSSQGLQFPDGSIQTKAWSPSASITTPNLNVQGSGGGLIISGSNLDQAASSPYSLASLPNSGKLLLGSNLSSGGGEQDFIGNRGAGASGGFSFYDYGNDGTLTQIANMTATGTSLRASLTLVGSPATINFPDQTVQATAWNGVLFGGDYAESVDVSGDREEYGAGDVLVIDPNSEGKFLKSSEPYSTAVTGIYSTKPGVVGRRQLSARAHMKEEVPMAMTGIVPTKVSAENGPIKSGDLLVTSSKLGYAMRGTDRAQMLGAVIGKAIGHLDTGVGTIEVVVTLQ